MSLFLHWLQPQLWRRDIERRKPMVMRKGLKRKSTGWYFKIINSKENFEWRRHIAIRFSPVSRSSRREAWSLCITMEYRRCLQYLRMVTPSHIFGVPQKDMGRGTFGKTSIDEKKASITSTK